MSFFQIHARRSSYGVNDDAWLDATDCPLTVFRRPKQHWTSPTTLKICHRPQVNHRKTIFSPSDCCSNGVVYLIDALRIISSDSALSQVCIRQITLLKWREKDKAKNRKYKRSFQKPILFTQICPAGS